MGSNLFYNSTKVLSAKIAEATTHALDAVYYNATKVWPTAHPIPVGDDTVFELTLTAQTNILTFYYTQSANNGVTIDWGDGSATETAYNLSANISHSFSAGIYYVTFKAAEGVTWSPGTQTTSGSSTTTNCIIGNIGKSATHPEITYIYLGKGARLSQPSGLRDLTSITEIDIPEPIDNIAEYCFASCTNLVTVKMPATVTTVGKQAFSGCSAISEVHITDYNAFASINWTYAGSWDTDPQVDGFPGLHTLYLNDVPVTSATVPSNVTTWPLHVTQHCTSITSATIPNTITDIPDGGFAYCTSLTSISVPSSAQLQTSASLSFVGVFGGCSSLTTAAVAAGEIPMYTFRNCVNLSSVTLSNITNIGENAFENCQSLSSLFVPDSVTSLSTLFMGDSYLEHVTIDANNATYSSVDDVVYKDATLYAYPPRRAGTTFVIPSNVTTIAANSFRGAQYIEYMTIPATVTKSNGAFRRMPNLESIEIGAVQISQQEVTGNPNLVHVWIRSTCTTIAAYAFIDNSSLPRLYAERSSAASGWTSNWNRKTNTDSDTSTYPVTYNQTTRPW